MKSFYVFVLLLSSLVLFNQKSGAQAPGWLWAKSFGAGGNDLCESIAVDDSGNVYAAGSYDGTVDFDPGPGTFNMTSQGILDGFVLKLDAAGNFIWAVSMGGTGTDKVYSIDLDLAGNPYVTGRYANTVDFDPGAGVANLTSNGDKDVFIVKLTSAGSLSWAKSVGGTGIDEGYGISVDSASNVIVTGTYQNTVDFDPDGGVFSLMAKGGFDAFVMKLEGGGAFLWAVTYGGVLADDAKSVATDLAGSVFVTGYFIDVVDFDPGAGTSNLTTNGYMDVYVLKLDPSGNYIWAKNLGGSQTDNGWDIYADPPGNVYTTGTFLGTADFDPDTTGSYLSAVGNSDVFISRLNDDGTYGWAGSIGASQADWGYCITADIYGNIYTSGIFRQTVDFDPGPGGFSLTASDNDGYILKLDTSGNFVWALKIGGTGQYSEQITSMGFDQNNYLYVGGDYMSYQVVIGNDTLTKTGAPGASADFFIAKLDSGLSVPSGIHTNSSSDAVSVYPNPAKDLLVVKIPMNDKQVTITVTDISGKQHIKTDVVSKGRIEINTTDLAGGVYFIQIQSDQFSETKKVVVIK